MSLPRGRISPSAGPVPAQVPMIQDGQQTPPLPLDAAVPGLPPAAGGPPPLAIGPTVVDFSSGEFRERFDRLVDFALTPPPEPPPRPPVAAPPPRLPPAADLDDEDDDALSDLDPDIDPDFDGEAADVPPRARSPLPANEQALAASRLDATRILCQQIVGNHAAARYFLDPEGGVGFFRRLLRLDAERRILIIDSLVDIVRSGREPAAAANIVDNIQCFALSYLNPAADENQLDSADQILPRLVQRVMERDSGSNSDPMWVRLVAIANLFGRRMRGQDPDPQIALEVHVSSGGDPLPSDADFRAALTNFNPDDPANSPLARVLNSEPAAEDLKGRFRKLAYGDERVRGLIGLLIAEYPDALYVVPNRTRVVHVLRQRDGIQAVFRDRYFFSDPDPRVLRGMLSQIRGVLTGRVTPVLQARLDIWQLLQANLNRLNNHPSPEIRRATSGLIMDVALWARDGEVAAAAKSLLSVKQRIILADTAIFDRAMSNNLGHGATAVARVANYVVGAPGLIVGGLFGLVGGFFKGLFTGRNPLKTAVNTAVDGAVYGSLVLGGFVGALLVVTPRLTAKIIPRFFLPVTSILTYICGLPGTFIGSVLGGIIGGVVGLFNKHGSVETAKAFALGGAAIGTYLFGGFVGTIVGFIIDITVFGSALLMGLAVQDNLNLIPRFFDPHRGRSDGGTIGAIVTGFPAAIVCGVAGAILGGIGGFIVGLFQGHPLRGAAAGAGALVTIGLFWGGFIGGGFIGYAVGGLIGLIAGRR